MKKVIGFTLLVLALGACNYDVQKAASNRGAGATPQPPSEGGAGGGGTVSPLHWENVYATSIQTSCFGCHAAPRNAAGINLETYENVFTRRAAIRSAVANRVMPDEMGRTMPDSARQLLIDWIDAGAPRDPQTLEEEK